jgi:hypothetical protein
MYNANVPSERARVAKTLHQLRETMMTHPRASTNRHDIKHPRTDFRTRDVVNQAIASIPTVGLQRAAEFLSAMNVPAEVAIRTLVYPNRRRH